MSENANLAVGLSELATQVRTITLRQLEVSEGSILTWAPRGTSNHILWHAGHALWVADVLTIEPITGRGELPNGWAESFGEASRPSKRRSGLLPTRFSSFSKPNSVESWICLGRRPNQSLREQVSRYHKAGGHCCAGSFTDGTTKPDTRAKCICSPSFIETDTRNSRAKRAESISQTVPLPIRSLARRGVHDRRDKRQFAKCVGSDTPKRVST